jgi:hypothetical protein
MAKSTTQGADRRSAGQSTDVFEFPPAWLPEDNEKVVGTVTARERAENMYGLYVVLTIRPDAGQTITVKEAGKVAAQETDGEMVVAVHCFGAVLANAMRRIRPAEGARLGFRKLGKMLPRGMDASRAKESDYFNGWQVRDLTVKSDDELFGATDTAAPSGQFNDEPPF